MLLYACDYYADLVTDGGIPTITDSNVMLKQLDSLI